MLIFESTKNNGGFVLWGDYWTLRELHQMCFDIVDRSPQLNPEGLVMSLAYTLRKAFEGQRQSTNLEHFNDKMKLYGVEQVWPTFIVQSALLRNGLAFGPSSKLEQSMMYQIEHALEVALHAAFPLTASDILDALRKLSSYTEAATTELLGSRVSYFLSLTKAKRATELSSILSSLDKSLDSLLRQPQSRSLSGYIFDPMIYDEHSWDTVDESVKL